MVTPLLSKYVVSGYLRSLTAEALKSIILQADAKPLPSRLTRKIVLKNLEDGSWRQQLRISNALLEEVGDYVFDNPFVTQTVKSMRVSKRKRQQYSSGPFRKTYLKPMMCFAIAADTSGQDIVKFVRGMCGANTVDTLEPILTNARRALNTFDRTHEYNMQVVADAEKLIDGYAVEQQVVNVVNDYVYGNKKRKTPPRNPPVKHKRPAPTRGSSSETPRNTTPPAASRKARRSTRTTKPNEDKS